MKFDNLLCNAPSDTISLMTCHIIVLLYYYFDTQQQQQQSSELDDDNIVVIIDEKLKEKQLSFIVKKLIRIETIRKRTLDDPKSVYIYILLLID